MIMKRSPTYWYDFDRNNVIIVQSDYPGGGRLAECASVEEADKLINDFESGRKTPKWDKVNYK